MCFCVTLLIISHIEWLVGFNFLFISSSKFYLYFRSVPCLLMVGSLEDLMGMLWAIYALKHRYLIFIIL